MVAIMILYNKNLHTTLTNKLSEFILESRTSGLDVAGIEARVHRSAMAL
jgi:hypothetical protein